MKNLFSTLTAVIILVCGCVYFQGCTPAKNPPVITSFSASPASIEEGGSSTLSWTINGARSASLDNGIGNVAVKGTRAVTPSATTVYVLTATNAAGDTTASTQVIVPGTVTASSTATSTTVLPTINSFSASPNSVNSGAPVTLSWSVANATSVNIQPGIGNVAASGSTTVMPGISMQFILTATNSNGSNQASTQIIVASDTTGTTGTSTGTTTAPALQIGPVLATPLASTAYDFIIHAPDAMWVANDGRLTYGHGADHGDVGVRSTILEDGKSHEVLATIPDFAPNGYIWGAFTDMASSYTVKSGDRFTSKIGYIRDATGGDANFIVKVKPAGSDSYTQVAKVRKTYTGTLTALDVPLSAYAGKNISVELRVEDNNTRSGMDWTVWVNPRITR